MISLPADSEPSVQEQALALLRNLLDGSIDCVKFIFAEDGVILDAVRKQLQNSSKAEIRIQVRVFFLVESFWALSFCYDPGYKGY